MKWRYVIPFVTFRRRKQNTRQLYWNSLRLAIHYIYTLYIYQIFLYRGKNKSKLNQKSGRQGNLNGVEKGKIKNKLNEVVKKGRTCRRRLNTYCLLFCFFLNIRLFHLSSIKNEMAYTEKERTETQIYFKKQKNIINKRARKKNWANTSKGMVLLLHKSGHGN